MIEHTNRVREIENISATMKALLYALASRADNAGLAYPSFSRLKLDTGISNKGTLANAIHEAENRGLLFVDRTHGLVNRYHLKLLTSTDSATSTNIDTSTDIDTSTSTNIDTATSSNIGTQKKPLNKPFKNQYRKTQKNKATIPDVLNSVNGFNDIWQSFLDNRKALKKPAIKRAQELILKKLSKCPDRAIDALNVAIERGWIGFEWDWINNSKNGSNNKPKTGITAYTEPEFSMGARKVDW